MNYRLGGIRVYYITPNGKLRCLDPNTVIHINSSGALIGDMQLPWTADGRFKKITEFVSAFLIWRGQLYVRNTLQELATDHEGRIFGGEPGYSFIEEFSDSQFQPWTPDTHDQTSALFQETMMTLMCGLRRLQAEADGLPHIDPVVIEEAMSGRTEARVEKERKHGDRYWWRAGEPFGVFHYTYNDVHYTEWKRVSTCDEFANTTFVFDESGIQIYRGNVAAKPLTGLKPLHTESWQQEVENKRTPLVERFLDSLEREYVSTCRGIQDIIMRPGPVDKKTHDWDDHSLVVLYDISSNIMIDGMAYSDIEEERAHDMRLGQWGYDSY